MKKEGVLIEGQGVGEESRDFVVIDRWYSEHNEGEEEGREIERERWRGSLEDVTLGEDLVGGWRALSSERAQGFMAR